MVNIEKKFIVLAILIRVLIMPWFYHPDIKTQHFHFQFLRQGVFNIYEYIQNNKSTLAYKDTFNYLPLTYLTFGSIQSLFSPILTDKFDFWINDWGSTQNTNPSMPHFLLILKIPYLIADILIAYILFKLYKNKKIVNIWLFNPISIYLIYIVGNFDIIPSFLTLLAFYLNKKNRYVTSYLIIGVAIALKMYPLMFVPFLVLNNKKIIIKQSLLSLFSLLPLVIMAIPFLFTNSFSQAFLGSGLTQKIIEFKILNLPIFPLVYLIILANLFFSKKENRIEIAFLQTMLLFLGLVKFHAQWILWFLPMIIVLFKQIKMQNILVIFILILSLIYIFLLNDNYLFWGHLIPIDSEFVNQTSPHQLIKLKLHQDSNTIQSQIHSLILFLGTLTSLIYVKKNN